MIYKNLSRDDRYRIQNSPSSLLSDNFLQNLVCLKGTPGGMFVQKIGNLQQFLWPTERKMCRIVTTIEELVYRVVIRVKKCRSFQNRMISSA